MPRLTVATFNARYGTANDGPNHWEHRWPLFGDVLKGLDADVLGLQECLTFQLDHAKFVTGCEAVGVSRENGRAEYQGERVPVLWRADKLELVEAGHFWVSPDPHVAGDRGWASFHPRMVTWAALRFRDPPRPLFTVFNTHFDYWSVPSREGGAALLRRRVSALGPHMPVLVMGDFNCTERDAPYATLTGDHLEPGDGLADAYRVAHPEPGEEDGTFHDFSGHRDGRRIDWVLASRHWRVASCRYDHTARDGRYPSDHFPVVAELELPG